MKWLALAGAAVAGVIVSAAPARVDREAGRKMSLEHCARCHVIGDFNPFGGIGSTPSSGCWPGATTGWNVSRPFTIAGRIRSSCACPAYRAGPSCLRT